MKVSNNDKKLLVIFGVIAVGILVFFAVHAIQKAQTATEKTNKAVDSEIKD